MKNSILKKYKYTLGICMLILLMIQTSCGSSKQLITVKPEPEPAAPLVYDQVPSYINVPVNIKLNDIQNQINNALSGLIYEDKNITDDDVEIRVWKHAPITIKQDGSNNQQIKITLPLKANIKHRIGTSTMGVDLYKTNEFNLNSVITLTSYISLVNWKLKSKTQISNIEWKESPSIVMYGKNVPLTYVVDPALKLFKKDIEKSLDDAIEASMDFKPNVLDAIEKIASPFKMNDTFESWLRIVPSEIYSSDVQLKNNNLMVQLGMKCQMETFIGQQPENKFDAKNVALKSVSKLQNQISSNIVAISTFQDASRIIAKNFVGQEFGDGKKKVTVIAVDMWHKQGKMVIALGMQGTINGTIYLEGIPKYNPEAKEIYFDDLQYVLDTKNKLLKTVNWMASGVILKKIQNSCRYSIQPNLEDAKKTMTGYLNNYSPMPGVFVNGNINDIEFQRIQLSNTAMLAFLKITGNVSVKVDGLK